MSAHGWDREDSTDFGRTDYLTEYRIDDTLTRPTPGASTGGRHAAAPRWGVLRVAAVVAATLTALGAGAYGGGLFLDSRAVPARTTAATEVEPARAPSADDAVPGTPTDPATADSPNPTPSSARSSARPSPSRSSSSRAARSQPRTSVTPGDPSTESAVLALVNAERAEAGCAPVTANTQLATSARGHARDMAARNYFSHTSQDGRTLGDRVDASGYRWSGIGENIAKGYADAEQVMEGWMNSSGHRANILNCSYRHLGIGLATSSKGSRYWVQVFGTPR